MECGGGLGMIQERHFYSNFVSGLLLHCDICERKVRVAQSRSDSLPLDYTVQGTLQARVLSGSPFPSPGVVTYNEIIMQLTTVQNLTGRRSSGSWAHDGEWL